MVPSVDRVGRYFPLTLVAELPDDVSLIAAATDRRPFFDSAERLVIETLAADDIDFERFDERVVELGDELESITLPPRVVLDPAAAALLNDDAQVVADPDRLRRRSSAPVFEQLLSQRLSAMYDPLVLWWTEGSSVVEPSCLIAKGLPHPSTFAALLDGSWAQYRWRSVPARVETSADPGDTLVDDATPLGFRSAAATDVGLAREINEDAFVERPEVGVWAVADGLGGHRDGEVASRMVCDALADFVPDPSFEGTIEAARATPAAGQRAPAPHRRRAPRSPIEAPAPSWCCWSAA